MGLQPTRERFKSFHFAEAALQNNDSSVDDIASQSPCRHGLICDAFQSIWKLMRMYGWAVYLHCCEHCTHTASPCCPDRLLMHLLTKPVLVDRARYRL